MTLEYVRTDRRVLLVDDDQSLLDGIARHLRNDFEVTTATSAREGIKLLEKEAYAVVVSDLRMPEIDGIAFLGTAREIAPDTVRMLLSGNADLEAAIEIVNRGQVFRFLTKPASIDLLRESISGAIAQYDLVVAERELLEQTLRGSIETLIETLALANPAAFARAKRIHRIVTKLLDESEITDRWEIEVAAMLSQLGAVILPADLAERVHHGHRLNAEEQAMVDGIPATSEGLLANIPRLDGVRAAIRFQGKHYDGRGTPSGAPRGDDIPLGARMLRLALDVDTLETQGVQLNEALAILRSRKGLYDSKLLDLHAGELETVVEHAIHEMATADLRPGMRLARDIVTTTGLLLVGRGHQVTETVLRALDGYNRSVGIAEPVYVVDE